MDYIKIRFSNDFGEIASSLEKTIEDLFRSTNQVFTFSERTWKPQMDIYETLDEVIILAEVAGVDKEDLGVEISSRAVKISGKRSEIARMNDANYRLAEIQYGKFERILYLPTPIDTEVVSASYSNGFLDIRLAKLPKNKTYKISID